MRRAILPSYREPLLAPGGSRGAAGPALPLEQPAAPTSIHIETDADEHAALMANFARADRLIDRALPWCTLAQWLLAGTAVLIAAQPIAQAIRAAF